jgi:hypothetical protein
MKRIGYALIAQVSAHILRIPALRNEQPDRYGSPVFYCRGEAVPLLTPTRYGR